MESSKKSRLKKRILWTIVLLILIPVLGLAGFIGYAALTEYNPAEIEDARMLNIKTVEAIALENFEITTYNIGYCGMDANQDFFMDDGVMSRSSSLEQTETNMKKVIEFIDSMESDAYFIQEVDESATRSHQMNQIVKLVEAFPEYSATFAYNYKANWVPVPIAEPMGKAYAGLMTLSKNQAESSTRYQLPGYESIPTRYVDLKRCVMTNTYPMENGKTLILVNVHLSAFDKGGVIRAQQIDWLNGYLTELYNPDENYIIVGGDWNHLMSQEIFDRIVGEPESWIAIIPDSLTANGFSLVYDNETNSVRSAIKPYVEGENFETIIDGFLVSPNIEVVSVKTHDLNFENSDHQPVTAIFNFK